LKEVPPRPRHKAKPKFDIPVETDAPEPSVGWVYRADDAPLAALAVKEAPRPQHQVYEPPLEENRGAVLDTFASFGTSFLMVGAGFCLIGLGAIDFTARAAIGMITLPVQLVKGILK
jgi:hypothetical protein